MRAIPDPFKKLGEKNSSRFAWGGGGTLCALGSPTPSAPTLFSCFRRQWARSGPETVHTFTLKQTFASPINNEKLTSAPETGHENV